jgi:hypothetical protein
VLARLAMPAPDSARYGVALLLPSPSLRREACALPGRDGKAGSPIESESRICEVAARTTVARSLQVAQHALPVAVLIVSRAGISVGRALPM